MDSQHLVSRSGHYSPKIDKFSLFVADSAMCHSVLVVDRRIAARFGWLL